MGARAFGLLFLVLLLYLFPLLSRVNARHCYSDMSDTDPFVFSLISSKKRIVKDAQEKESCCLYFGDCLGALYFSSYSIVSELCRYRTSMVLKLGHKVVSRDGLRFLSRLIPIFFTGSFESL